MTIAVLNETDSLSAYIPNAHTVSITVIYWCRTAGNCTGLNKISSTANEGVCALGWRLGIIVLYARGNNYST